MKEVLRQVEAEGSLTLQRAFVRGVTMMMRTQRQPEGKLDVMGLNTSQTLNAAAAFTVAIKFATVVDHSQQLALDRLIVYWNEAFV